MTGGRTANSHYIVLLVSIILRIMNGSVQIIIATHMCLWDCA
jgi:hypothetical protein